MVHDGVLTTKSRSKKGTVPSEATAGSEARGLSPFCVPRRLHPNLSSTPHGSILNPTMKKSLKHLPPQKRQELTLIRQIITETVPETQMIVLFGSYARGDWVEDLTQEGHIIYEYKSDFDILVITKDKRTTSSHLTQSKQTEEAIRQEIGIRTPVSIIYHDIEYLNHRLSEGHYFFTDIKKEGILLHDTQQSKLARRRKLDPQERKKIAQQDFKYWFKSAKEFYDDYASNLERRRYRKAAFELHQATEQTYAAILLVFNGYKPKTHNLKALSAMAASSDPTLLRIFPQASPAEQEAFQRLVKAYVHARYRPDYKITPTQLEYLGQRVKKLHTLASKICKQKIRSFSG